MKFIRLLLLIEVIYILGGEIKNKMIKKNYVITLTPTISNLFVSINSTKGHLYRTFTFANVNVIAASHRKRKLFAQEFGTAFAKYINNLKLNANFKIKVNGTDGRCFSFIEFFIKNGGNFNEIYFITQPAFNGCKTKKRKRI